MNGFGDRPINCQLCYFIPRYSILIVKGIAICYTICLYEKQEALNMVQSDYHYLSFSGQFTVANPFYSAPYGVLCRSVYTASTSADSGSNI